MYISWILTSEIKYCLMLSSLNDDEIYVSSLSPVFLII